jgi:hypothetical protein
VSERERLQDEVARLEKLASERQDEAARIEEVESEREELQDEVARLRKLGSYSCPQRKSLLIVQQLSKKDKKYGQTEDYVTYLVDQLSKQSPGETKLQKKLQLETTKVFELETKLADSSAEVQHLNTELISRKAHRKRQDGEAAASDTQSCAE